MSYRRPTPPKGSTRPGSRPQASRSRPNTRRSDNDPRLRDQGKTRRTIVFGASAGRPRGLSLRLLSILFFVAFALILIIPVLNRYMDQQEELRSVKASVEEAKARNHELELELALWQDPEYLKSQARSRLGFVTPGQVLYTVSDPDEGSAAEKRERIEQKLNHDRRAATPWFSTMWDSMKVAGYADNGKPVVVNPGDEPPKTPPVSPETESTP